MKKIIILIIFQLIISSDVLAHRGRTDSCGGHNDRKKGGYHVHDQSKYNTCHPQSDNSAEEKHDRDKQIDDGNNQKEPVDKKENEKAGAN